MKKVKEALNKTNGGFEPWIQGQKKQAKMKSFSPMQLPQDLEDSDDNDVPREITRENFGGTFTKFVPPNPSDKDSKNTKNSPKS